MRIRVFEKRYIIKSGELGWTPSDKRWQVNVVEILETYCDHDNAATLTQVLHSINAHHKEV
jgi:hypothetical protein